MEPSLKKFSEKMSEEEKASGISVEDFKEKGSLIGELVEREDTIQAKAESASKEEFKDNQIAEDIKVELLQNVLSRVLRNYWSTFCKRKQRLTTKLDNWSFV